MPVDMGAGAKPESAMSVSEPRIPKTEFRALSGILLFDGRDEQALAMAAERRSLRLKGYADLIDAYVVKLAG